MAALVECVRSCWDKVYHVGNPERGHWEHRQHGVVFSCDDTYKISYEGGWVLTATVVVEKKSRDHVIVSSGWWSYQAGRVEGGGSGTRDELGALHSALREQAPPAKGGENPSLQPALCSC